MKVDLLAPALVGLALSFAAGGCGGSNGGTCGMAPCGGDVVGNWQGTSACEDRATLSMDILPRVMNTCSTLSLGAVNMTSTGTLDMAADMSFTGTLVVNAAIGIIYPPACIANSSCAQVETTLQSLVGTGGITSATCTGTGSCTCTLALTVPIVNATGTWTTSGTMLTFAGAPGGNGPYCVQGSSLHLLAYDLATNTKIINDIVLTRQ